jgi:transporter family-2 protein
MTPWSVVPVVLGAVAVLQGMLNRELAQSIGLGRAAAINGAVVATALAAVYAAVRASPQHFPELFQPRPGPLPWWVVAPGLCGGVVVLITPWAIARVGAAPVFIGVVAGQMWASLALDAWILGAPTSWPRLLGATMTMAGVVLASWK